MTEKIFDFKSVAEKFASDMIPGDDVLVSPEFASGDLRRAVVDSISGRNPDSETLRVAEDVAELNKAARKRGAFVYSIEILEPKRDNA